MLIHSIHYEIQYVFPINLPILNFHRTISFQFGGKHCIGNGCNTILCYCPWVISAQMKLVNLRKVFQIDYFAYSAINIAFNSVIGKDDVKAFFVKCLPFVHFLIWFCNDMDVMSFKQPFLKSCVHIWVIGIVLGRRLSKKLSIRKHYRLSISFCHLIDSIVKGCIVFFFNIVQQFKNFSILLLNVFTLD